MQKPEKVVIQNTLYIAIWQVILAVLMQAVYLLIDKWSPSVLYGCLVTSAVAVLNFFAMAITVQKAVSLEQKQAAAKMKVSQLMRYVFLIAAAVVACKLFDPIASVLPLLFPRFAIMLFPLFNRKNKEVGDDE